MRKTRQGSLAHERELKRVEVLAAASSMSARPKSAHRVQKDVMSTLREYTLSQNVVTSRNRIKTCRKPVSIIFLMSLLLRYRKEQRENISSCLDSVENMQQIPQSPPFSLVPSPSFTLCEGLHVSFSVRMRTRTCVQIGVCAFAARMLCFAQETEQPRRKDPALDCVHDPCVSARMNACVHARALKPCFASRSKYALT